MLKPSTQYAGPIMAADYMSHGSGYARGDANRVMSRSELKRFAWCPSRWLAGAPDDESASTEWGSLIDCLALTPTAFEEQYAVTPATYPCEPSKKDPRTEKPWTLRAGYCETWEEMQREQGKIPISPTGKHGYLAAQKAVSKLLGNPKVAALLESSRRQVAHVVEWHDEITGLVIPLKVLIDVVPIGHFSRYLVDLKTTANAHPGMWPREVHKHWYDAQAAIYLDAHNVSTGERRDTFLHIKQENFAPYEVATCMLSEDFILSGRKRYQDALRTYCQCIQTDNWPDYDSFGESYQGFTICEPEPFMILHQQ